MMIYECDVCGKRVGQQNMRTWLTVVLHEQVESDYAPGLIMPPGADPIMACGTCKPSVKAALDGLRKK